MGLLQHTPATATVIHLDDYRVPSLRRRAAASTTTPARSGQPGQPDRWARAAQERASTRKQAAAVDSVTSLAGSGPAPTAVRVTRFADAAAARGPVRHLRLSGRLADVCAELDRLAAAETRQHALSRRA